MGRREGGYRSPGWVGRREEGYMSPGWVGGRKGIGVQGG